MTNSASVDEKSGKFAILYKSGDVLYSGKVKIKTGRGSFQRWRKRNVEIIYPCRMKLSKKKVMKKKVKEFSLTTFDRLEDAPWFGFRLPAEDDSRSIDVRCTDLYEYLNLVHALQMLLDMRKDASEFGRGIPEDVRSSGSLHDVREDNADKERDAVNELELIQRLGEDFPKSGDELVHQPHRHSKYTLAEMEKSRKNTATADDTETQHNAEKDSVSVTSDSAKPRSINLSRSNSSIASLEEILTSKSSSATVKSDDNEENQACNDDSRVGLNDITRQTNFQNQTSEEQRAAELQRAVDAIANYSGIFEDFLREDYQHPPPRLIDVIRNRLNRFRMACGRLCSEDYSEEGSDWDNDFSHTFSELEKKIHLQEQTGQNPFQAAYYTSSTAPKNVKFGTLINYICLREASN